MSNDVIYAGSFDPLHEGHLFVIDSATKIFDKVYLIVANNSDKQGKEFILFDERIRLISKVMKRRYPDVEVILLKDTFIADFAKDKEIKYLIRGLRNSDDFNQERLMSQVNGKFGDDLQTIFVMSPIEKDLYSSSLIKSFVGMINWEEKIEEMVPKEIYEHILFNYHGGKHEFMRSIRCCVNGKEGSEYKSDKTNTAIEEIFSKLHESYTKEGRHYHNLNHILFMLNELHLIDTTLLLAKDGLDLSEDDIKLLSISIWGHDHIYEPGSVLNEIKSADEYVDDLKKIGLDEGVSYKIHEMIMATGSYNDDSELDNPLHKVICDLDFLQGGKSNIEEWLTTSNKVRKEFSSFTDDEWRKGRAAFLKKMLAKDRIFKTQYFYDLYEENLRKNMKIELKNITVYLDEDWAKKESFD